MRAIAVLFLLEPGRDLSFAFAWVTGAPHAAGAQRTPATSAGSISSVVVRSDVFISFWCP